MESRRFSGSFQGLGLDPWLLVSVIGLCLASLITIKNATANDIPEQPYYFVERQAIYITVGLILMFILARIDYTRLRQFKRVAYGFLIGSTLLVFVLATATRNVSRWIELPFFRFQPSELGKLLLIIGLAAFVVDCSRRATATSLTLRTLALGLVPAFLVMMQPDLGTALVYVVGVFAMLFFAGIPWRHLGAVVALGLVFTGLVFFAAPSVGVSVLKPYQMSRLTSFVNPSDKPGSEGYQQQQSKIAIGSGEKTGKGEQGATQTELKFLPEHHTDFIFGVVGEMYGFAGASLVISLYALLVWRSLRILSMARNMFGALLVGGIIAMLLYQIFVNIGMTIGIMPITGVPAPLLSFGGSSMLVTLMSIGLLLSVNARKIGVRP
jgi:rod shape determining protein RodA